MDDTAPTADTTDDDSSLFSMATLDIPKCHTPTLHFVSATTRVIDIGQSGVLVNSGGNFSMCNGLRMLVNVQPITLFGINMVATQDKTAPICTHCGDFPIPMVDGSV